MKSILDPGFRYVPSTSTDLRKTFARVRRELQKAGAAEDRPAASTAARVVPFGRPKQPAAQH